MNFSSASLACTKTTSASPRRAVSSALPVPWATTLTTMPVFCLNSGRMWPNRPESCVEVVEATTMDLSCAEASDICARAKAITNERFRILGEPSLSGPVGIFCSEPLRFFIQPQGSLGTPLAVGGAPFADFPHLEHPATRRTLDQNSF